METLVAQSIRINRRQEWPLSLSAEHILSMQRNAQSEEQKIINFTYSCSAIIQNASKHLKCHFVACKKSARGKILGTRCSPSRFISSFIVKEEEYASGLFSFIERNSKKKLHQIIFRVEKKQICKKFAFGLNLFLSVLLFCFRKSKTQKRNIETLNL